MNEVFCKNCRWHYSKPLEYGDSNHCRNTKSGHSEYTDVVTGKTKVIRIHCITARSEHGNCWNGVLFQPKFTFMQKFMARWHWWTGQNFDKEALRN